MAGGGGGAAGEGPSPPLGRASASNNLAPSNRNNEGGRSNPSQLMALEALRKSREESRNIDSSLKRNVRIKNFAAANAGNDGNESKLDLSNHDHSHDQLPNCIEIGDATRQEEIRLLNQRE